MRYFLIIIFTFVCHPAFSQDADTITWQPGHKLEWKDFKGKPDTSSEFTAMCSSNIRYTYKITEAGLTYKVWAEFYCNNSWNKHSTDVGLLKHEQGHFDITAIFTKMLEKAFSHYKLDRIYVSRDLRELYDIHRDMMEDIQKKYDEETNHNRLDMKQKEWLKILADDVAEKYKLR